MKISSASACGIAAAAVATMFLAACSNSADASSGASAEDQIKATVEAFETAFNSADAEDYLAQVCAEQAKQETVETVEQQLLFAKAFAGKVTFEITNIQVDGETAQGDLLVTVSSPDASSDDPSDSTKFIREDGKWKLCEPESGVMPME